MNDKIWENYIVLGDNVYIFSTDGTLQKRNLFPNIDKILLLENRLSYLKEVYTNSFYNLLSSNYENPISKIKFNISAIASTLILEVGLINILPSNNILSSIGTIVFPVSTITVSNIVKAKINKKKSEEIVNSSYAVIKLCELEKSKCVSEIKELKKDKIDKDKVVKNRPILIDEDKNYHYQFLAKEGLLEDYGKMEKNLIKKYKRGKLEGYLGSIGCDEDEKSIITDLVKENNSINKKKTLQYKKIR